MSHLHDVAVSRERMADAAVLTISVLSEAGFSPAEAIGGMLVTCYGMLHGTHLPQDPAFLQVYLKDVTEWIASYVYDGQLAGVGTIDVITPAGPQATES